MLTRNRIAGATLTFLAAAAGALVVPAPVSALGTVTTLQNRGTALCLTASGTGNGSPVVQSACTGSDYQRWARVSLGNGYEQLRSVASTTTYPYEPRCLDVTDGVNADRTPVQVWACTNTPGMNWRFVYGERHYLAYYKVQTKVGGRCLDVPAGSDADGLQLQIYSCTAGTTNQAQLWGVPLYGG